MNLISFQQTSFYDKTNMLKPPSKFVFNVFGFDYDRRKSYLYKNLFNLTWYCQNVDHSLPLPIAKISQNG